jgi:hypothetical protein
MLDYHRIHLFFTVHVARQPNIYHGLEYQTNIALNLFNTILDIVNTLVNLNHSWEAIEQNISSQKRWESRSRKPRNHP